MDIERIDWWEKEKPPFVWYYKDQYDFFKQFQAEKQAKFLKEWVDKISQKPTLSGWDLMIMEMERIVKEKQNHNQEK